MPQPLNVVVTGASSGIGLATAEAFAAEGARLFLVARRAEPLAEAAARCRALGGEAHAFPADVTDLAAIPALAARAKAVLGRIDLWASIVGVGVVGRYHEVPFAEHERVIRADLLSHMAEAHAVLPILVEQGRGTWVNMISLGGFASTPWAAAYGASKFGLKGFSEALRGELVGHRDVHVCDVYPSFVDTPGIVHAANATGKKLSVPPPVLDARRVARAIARLARHPRPTTMVGSMTRAIRLGHAVSPRLVAASMYGFIDAYFRRAEDVPRTAGNLFDAPAERARVDGGLRSPGQRGAALAVGGVVAAGLGVWAIARRKRSSSSPRP